MADFGQLKLDVESSMARSDIPDFVYRLAASDVNAMRLLPMQATTTLAVSTAETALPSDFMAIDNAYVDAEPRVPLLPLDEHGNERAYMESGAPRYYAIVDGAMRVNPAPDGEYSVVMRYYAKLADFVFDTDTNDVLTNYPSLYLYASLHRAAIWSQDIELMTVYSTAWANERSRVAMEDRMARHGKGLAMRAERAA